MNSDTEAQLEDSLSTAEKHFILQQFEDAIISSYDSLLSISYHSVRNGDISGETDYSELEEYAEEGDLKSKEALRSFEKLCLLYHECSGLQEEEENKQVQCSCVPFVAIVLQSIFQMNRTLPEPLPVQRILAFLWSFYGNIMRVPFHILFLTINQLAIGGHYKEAKELLTYCFKQNNKSSDVADTIQNEMKNNLENYESLIQLYVFHVLPPLGQWDEASQFIASQDVLPDWKKEAFKQHLKSMHSQDMVSKLAPVADVIDTEYSAPQDVEDPKAALKSAQKLEVTPTSVTSQLTSKYHSLIKYVLAHLQRNHKIWSVICSISIVMFGLVLYFNSRRRSRRTIRISRAANNKRVVCPISLLHTSSLLSKNQDRRNQPVPSLWDSLKGLFASMTSVSGRTII